jgi:hypothetical protein
MRQLCRACKMLVGRAFELCVSRKCSKAEESEKQCGSRNWVEQMALSSNNTWLIEVGAHSLPGVRLVTWTVRTVTNWIGLE